jgi:hypothetical protein
MYLSCCSILGFMARGVESYTMLNPKMSSVLFLHWSDLCFNQACGGLLIFSGLSNNSSFLLSPE